MMARKNLLFSSNFGSGLDLHFIYTRRNWKEKHPYYYLNRSFILIVTCLNDSQVWRNKWTDEHGRVILICDNFTADKIFILSP